MIHTVRGSSIVNEAEAGVLANQLQKLILTAAGSTNREPVLRWRCGMWSSGGDVGQLGGFEGEASPVAHAQTS